MNNNDETKTERSLIWANGRLLNHFVSPDVEMDLAGEDEEGLPFSARGAEACGAALDANIFRNQSLRQNSRNTSPPNPFGIST